MNAAASGHSYGQILRSSVIIGGSTVFNVATGIVRSKAIALLLGPAGFGLMGLYTSIVNLARSIAGMGINNSGVRQIAAAVGTGEHERVARTAAVLRWTSVILGLFGASLLLVLSAPVALLTFGNHERTIQVALLAVIVLIGTVSDGQGALLQGLRRISDIARVSVYGSLVGAVLTVVLVYLFHEGGVVPSLIATAGMTLVFSWWYSRKLRFERPLLSARDVGHEAGALLRLGFAFLASGMLMTGAAYFVRIIIVRKLGIQAAGLYQSAFVIGGLYVGFILEAMGSDFYPRLTASIGNREECNRLVNEQAQVSLLLAGPGVLGTLVFAPLVLTLFYSAAFRDAVGLLQWLCLGASLRVITWPMGFIVVASGKQNLFVAVEVAYTVVYLAAALLCVSLLGIDGVGVAFLISYVFHGLMIYPVVRSLSGFRWSVTNKRLIAYSLALIGLVFYSFRVLPYWAATSLGSVALVASGVFSLRTLAGLVSAEAIPRPFRRLAGWARIGSSRTSPGRDPPIRPPRS